MLSTRHCGWGKWLQGAGWHSDNHLKRRLEGSIITWLDNNDLMDTLFLHCGSEWDVSDYFLARVRN